VTPPAPLEEMAARVRHLLAVGRPDDAAPLVERHLAEHPDDVVALVLLSACRHAGGRHDEAISVAAHAAALAPEFPLAHRQLAALMLETGRIREGLAAAHTARELDPEDHRNELVMVYALLGAGGTGNIAAADRAVARARQLAPEDPMAYVAEGDVQRRMARFGAARTAYERALALAPDDPVALSSLAELDAGRGYALSASPLLAASLAAAPTDESVVRMATRSARAALWLITDIASLIAIAASLAALAVRTQVDGPAGVGAAVVTAGCGLAGAAAYVRWRLRALSGPTRALIRQNLHRPTFALAALRVLVTAVAAVLFAIDPDPSGAGGVKVFAMPATSLPFILLLLRARNWFAREVSWQVRRGWFSVAARRREATPQD
jgi:tetratricopeptide (TPR) repeat protein